MLPKDFYDKVEEPGILKHILYSDTDSLFIVVPDQNSNQKTTEEKMEIANKVSEDINSAIITYLNNYLLPKSNISSNKNMTFFKSEMLFDSIMFLDVKKNYAYKILAKKGKIFKTPKVNYTGIQVVKSDAARITQNILKDMIEEVILNPEIAAKNRLTKISEIIDNYYKTFIDCCDNLDLAEISFPGKWQKKSMFIEGMKLYNFIMRKEIFSPGSAGNFIYCIFRNSKLFTNVDMSKVNGIVVPYIYDKDLLREKMKQFMIEIDRETQWSKLFTTTCDRIINLVKNQKEK